MFKNLFKKEEKPKDEDPATKITNLGKVLCEEPASLNELMKDLCCQLATVQPFLVERVDLALGAVIGRHSSRMLSTVWTVLLQQLRESTDHKAQLRMLKHFSGVSTRIAVAQRGPAFAAFGNALMLLLTVQEVVGDRQFAETVINILIPLGTHGVEEYCMSLLDKCVAAVTTWTRMDARRSAAAIIGGLVRYTRHAGTYTGLLTRIEDAAPMSKALIVDAALPHLLNHAQLLRLDPTSFPCLQAYKTFVSEWLMSLVSVETDVATLETSVLSSVIRSYERLLEFMPSAALWEASGTVIVKGALKLLGTPKLKKVLICPLIKILSFLRVSDAVPTAGAASPTGGYERDDSEALLELLTATQHAVQGFTQADDPTARAEAWGSYMSVFGPMLNKRALGIIAPTSPLQSPRTAMSNTSLGATGRRSASYASPNRIPRWERESASTMLELLGYFREEHHEKFTNRCNITCRAMLAFIGKLAPLCESFTASAEVGVKFGDLIAYLFRAHSDRGIKLNQTPVIQTALLEVLQTASARISNVYVLSYTLDCIQDGDARVRGKGVQTLLALAERCPIEVEDLRKAQHYDVMSFLEGVSVASSTWKPEQLTTEEALQWTHRNYSVLLHHAHTTLITNGLVMDKRPANTVQSMCSIINAVQGMMQHTGEAGDGATAAALGMRMRSHFTELNLEVAQTLMDILLSPVSIPGDVLVQCTGTMAQCLENTEASVVLGDAADGYRHKSLFSFAFGLLCICCKAIDPVAMPNIPTDPQLYLSHFVVGDALGKMVGLMGQNAQAGSSEQFRELVDNVLRLVAVVFTLGRNSNLFRVHMNRQNKMVLICCDIAAALVPNRTLETVRKIFDVMFVMEDTEQSNAGGGTNSSNFNSACTPTIPTSNPASSNTFAKAVAGNVDTVAGLLPGTQATDVIAFIKRVVPVLNRALMFDLVTVGPTLFGLLEYFLSIDIQALHETMLYAAIDPDKELFKRIHTIATDPAYYNKVVGASVPKALIDVVTLVIGSDYEESCFAKIKHMTPEETYVKLLDLAKDAQGNFNADVFLQCRLPLAGRTPKAAEVLRWEEASSWDDVQWSLCNHSAHAFQQDPEACQQYAARLMTVAAEAASSGKMAVCSKILSVFETLSAHTEVAELNLQALKEVSQEGGKQHNQWLPLMCLTVLDYGKFLPVLIKAIFALDAKSRPSVDQMVLLQARLLSCPSHHTEEMVNPALDVPGTDYSEMGEVDPNDPNSDEILSPELVSLWVSILDHFGCTWKCEDWAALLGAYQMIPPLYHALLNVCIAAESSVPSACAVHEVFWHSCLVTPKNGSKVAAAVHQRRQLLASKSGAEDQVVRTVWSMLQSSGGFGSTLEAKTAAKQLFTELGPEYCSSLLALSLEDSDAVSTSSSPKLRMFLYWVRKQVGEESFASIAKTRPESFTDVCNVLPYRGSMMMPLLSSGLLETKALAVQDINRMAHHVASEAEAGTLVHRLVNHVVENSKKTQQDPAQRAQFASLAATTWFALGRRCANASLNITFTPLQCANYCAAAIELLQTVPLLFEDELHCALRLSIISFMVGSNVDHLHWERIVTTDDAAYSQTIRSPRSTEEQKNFAAEKWAVCRESFTEVLYLCSMRQEQAAQLKKNAAEAAAKEKEGAGVEAAGGGGAESEIPTSSIPDRQQTDPVNALCRYVASALLFSRHGHSSLDGSVFWHVVRCLPLRTVRVVLTDDSLIQITDPECLRFFCKLTQTIGLCRELLMELHARYTPLLVHFGQPDQQELDNDQQRALMWYTTCLLVHTTVSEERHTKAKVHYSMMDGLAMYADYPLAQMSLPSAQKVRNLIDTHLLSDFHKTFLFGQHATRFWNSHTHAFLLPVRKPLRLEKSLAEKTFSSILHMYIHGVSTCFNSADTVGTQAIADVFTSLQTVSWLNPPLLKHSPHTSSATIATTILQLLFSFYKTHFAGVIASASGNESSTLVGNATGFPQSSASVDYHDGHSLCSLMNTVVSLFSKGHELLPGAIDSTYLVEKMLVMDIFTNQAAHTAVLVMAGASTRREVERLSRLFMQRLGTDITRYATAPLTMSFCMLQSLRTAFTFIASGLEESVVMKACEVLWNSVVWKHGGGRRIQHYTHFLLQSIVHMQVISETQWHILRAIVTLPNNEPKAVELSSFQKAIEGFSAKAAVVQDRLNKLTSDGGDVGAPGAQAEGTSIADLLEGNSAANRTYATTANLLHLTTLSAFTLRSKTTHSNDEDEGDMSRVDALDMLRQVAEEPTAVGEVFIQVVYNIVGQVMDSTDLLFVVLNRFNFSTSALVLFSTHLQKLVREPGAQLTMLMSQLSLFFDAAARREQTLAESWWTVAALLCSLYSFVNEPEAAALSKCLCGRLNALPLEAVCWYVWSALRRSGRTKDTKLLLRSMEASLRGVKEAEEARAVTKTLRRWMDDATGSQLSTSNRTKQSLARGEGGAGSTSPAAEEGKEESKSGKDERANSPSPQQPPREATEEESKPSE